MTKEVKDLLMDLRDRTGADSLAEVVRRSVAVYDHLWQKKEEGASLIVRSPEGEKELLLL
jgi:hypothetical protein